MEQVEEHFKVRGSELKALISNHFWKCLLLLGTLIPLSIHLGPIYFVQALLMWSTVFTLALGIFRYDVMDYLKRAIPSVLLMSIITAFIQSHKMIMLVTTAQPLLAIICLIVLFRIRWLHATIMITVTYATCIILETFVIYTLLSDDVVGRLREFKQLEGFIVSFINFVLIIIFRKRRLGFSFLGHHHRQAGRKSTAAVFIGLLLVALVSVSFILSDFMSAIIVTLLLLGLCGFYTAAYYKDRNEG